MSHIGFPATLENMAQVWRVWNSRHVWKFTKLQVACGSTGQHECAQRH